VNIRRKHRNRMNNVNQRGTDLTSVGSGNAISKKARPRPTGPAILKKARIAFALTFLYFCPDVAFAGGQECMAGYYRSKSPGCIDDVLAQLRQTPPSSREPNTAIGFFAQLFRASPQERERLLKTEPSDYVRSIELVGLYRAGLPDDAQKFGTANNLSSLSEKLRAMRLETLDAVRPASIPADNDLLIGAYMASGDIALIQRVLDNYSSADDGLVSDAFRIGLMMSKFGPGLAPKGRDNVTMQAACAKYQCKVDQTKLFRVMTLATAIWSLQSLAQQDDGIKKTLSDFLAHDTRLKTLFTAEQVAFGNYVTTMAGVTILKNDHTEEERERAYAAMSKSASIYENLGPANEAFAPFTSLTK
jgi:hypothetical protein